VAATDSSAVVQSGGRGAYVIRESNLMDEAIFYQGKQHAVLLIPGLVGTPREMRFIARALVNEGYTVSVPAVPGYAMGSRATDWEAWVEILRGHYSGLQQTHDTVSVGGLCIGGTLALALAAREPSVTSLALYAITLKWDGWAIPWYRFLFDYLYHTPIGKRFAFFEREPFGLKNEALRARVAKAMLEKSASEVGEASTSSQHIYQARQLAKYVESQLAHIKSDCLMIHGVDDDTTSPRNTMRVHDAIGSPIKRKILLDDCYHIITMDNERETVASETVAFFRDSVRRRTGSGRASETHIISKALRRAQRNVKR
jgi:carboxylesterase